MEGNGHIWGNSRGRRITQDGQEILHRQCGVCGRDFALFQSRRSWEAVYVGIFRIEPLSNEVTIRWASQNCPMSRLESDAADRITHRS